jgi:phage-related protein
MSELKSITQVVTRDKPLVWLRGEVMAPPFSPAARIEAGVLLRQLQVGASLGLPHSRPMSGIGTRCHDLRIVAEGATWRLLGLDGDVVVTVDVFSKKTRQAPGQVIVDCRRRLRPYDELTR